MKPSATDIEARVHQLRIWFAGTQFDAVSKAADWVLDPKGKDIDSFRDQIYARQTLRVISSYPPGRKER